MLTKLKKPRNAEEPPPLEAVSPLVEFFRQDIVAACLLMLSALAALILANSAWADWYHELWHTHFGFTFGDFTLDLTLHHWINDGLMAVFFFVVGLEIKRELLVGELASFRKAMLPAVAALGGMIFPALIYTALNFGTHTARGWGIPMATDIAFAMGCLAMLGGRVPQAIGVFLVALAIVDDLGSVVVIAVFYTEKLATRPLLVGTTLILLSYGLNRMGVRRIFPYVVIGAVVWFEFLESGVHATIAGVLGAFTIPATARYETPHFFGRMTTLLKRFTDAEDYVNPLLVTARQQQLVRSILRECHHVEAPLQRLEHALHPLCVTIILPVFAFSSSGVTLDLSQLNVVLTQSVTLGVFFGLVVGKQTGIMLMSWLAVKSGLAELPKGIGWKHVYGLSWLGGIGFTMALFINELAFKAGPGIDPVKMAVHVDETKVGVILASTLCGLVGYLFLRRVCASEAPGAGTASRH